MLFYTLCMAKWKAYYYYIKEVLAGQGRGYDVDGDYHDLPAPLKCPVDGCRIWTWAKYEGCESDYEIYCVRHKWQIGVPYREMAQQPSRWREAIAHLQQTIARRDQEE